MNEELKVIIRAELAQFKKAMSDAVSGLKQLANEGRRASKEIDGFTADVNQQGKSLQDLKKKYVDLAAAHGRESKAAKDAAEQIRKLSAEYKENKTLVSSLSKEADGFDLSFGSEEAGKSVDKTTEGMGELKDTLQGIYALDIWEFISKSFGKWTEKSREFADAAKAEMEMAGEYFKQAFGELFRDPDTMRDLDVQGESYKESIKGAGESAKYGLQEMGSGIVAAIKAIGIGIVAAAGMIVAIVITVIAAVKNALNVAKEIKAMANQASKAGMDTSTYQEWGYVLKQVGIEEDKLSDFTKKLAERQNELRDGSEEAEKAFEALGISAEEAISSNQEQLFRKTVVALQNVENSAERTSLAFRVFTDDATDLTNLLYLTNDETTSLIDNYYALGAAPSDNLINKSKILEGSTTNLKYAWQGLKNTLAEWVIPAVIAVVQWLTTAVAYINAFFQGIFHTKTATEKATNNVSQGVEEIGKSADKSTKKVKELLRYTMGFDELNVIPKQSSDSSSSGSGYDSPYSNTSINPDIPVIEAPDLSKFREWMDKYGIIIQSVLTWAGIVGGLIMLVFGICYFNIPLILAGIAAAGLGISIGQAGGDENAFAFLIDSVKGALGVIKGYFVDAWNGTVMVWNGATSWIGENFITPVSEFFKNLWEDIKEFFAPATEWFSELWTSVKESFESIWDVITGLAEGAWETIKHVWNGATTWFSENITGPIKQKFSETWTKVKEDASDAWTNVKEKAKDAWAGIKEAFSPITNWFKNKFEEAWEKVKGVFKKGGTIFEGFKENVSEVFKEVVNWLIDGINKAIAVPFNAINKMLNKLRNAEFLGISPFKDKWEENPLKVPQIPKLATGGITTGATMALIGERGREAVLPLENNTEWMDVLAARINNNTPSKIVLMLDGRELGWANINSINNITKQTGQLQLVW